MNLITLAILSIASVTLAALYNRFIEGKLRPFGYTWNQDENTDLSVVLGNGMATVTMVIAYAIVGPVSPLELAALMFWFWVCWGVPMIWGYRERLRRAANQLAQDLTELTRRFH